MEYIPAETQKLIDQRYKTTLIIVVAFLFSVVVFLIIGKVITPGEATPGSEKWGKGIYSIVIVLGVTAVALRRIFMSRMLIGQAAAGGPGAVLRHLGTVSVIGAAIAEAVAIIGLVAYMMTADYQYSWRLGVVGLFLVLYSIPRRGEWVRKVIEYAGEKSK